MNLSKAALVIGAALDADIPTFLWSGPGIGKSDTVAAVAEARGALFTDIRLSLFDPVDLRGLPAIVDGLTAWMRPAIWPVETDRETVLMFDEMDRAAPSVMSAAMQIVLNRRIGEHVLPDRVRIIAAGNGRSDKVGTNKIPSALANRFCHLDIDVDVNDWADWALRSGIDPALVSFIRFRPQMLHISTMGEADQKALSDRAFPSPRAWAKINGVMGAPDDVRHAIAAGLVGAAPAAEFEGFVRTMRQLPNLADIIANPSGSPVPADPSALYAMAGALARNATEANFGAVLTYAARMPREFEIVTALDASKRKPALVETPAFVAWAVRNAKVLA